jgi:hypothetical protein
MCLGQSTNKERCHHASPLWLNEPETQCAGDPQLFVPPTTCILFGMYSGRTDYYKTKRTKENLFENSPWLHAWNNNISSPKLYTIMDHTTLQPTSLIFFKRKDDSGCYVGMALCGSSLVWGNDWGISGHVGKTIIRTEEVDFSTLQFNALRYTNMTSLKTSEKETVLPMLNAVQRQNENGSVLHGFLVDILWIG